jgi:mannose-6-phosphate isomerase-like protein (cupin superfamily)
MKHISTANKRGLFKPLIESASVQAAMMTLPPGESSDEEVANEHSGAEQWLFVVSGTGRAKVAGRTVPLRDGSLLLIEKAERHQITNTGRSPLVTLNFYAPPAYTQAGEVKRSVKR